MKHKGFLRSTIFTAGAALGLFGTIPAKANLILTVQSVSAAAGSTSDALDVTLSNTGPGAVNIASFTFNISTSDTSISFVDATDATTLDPYIFPTGGLPSSEDAQYFSGDLLPSAPNSGQNFTGNVPSDTNVDGSLASQNVSVASGATLGLGHVLFHVAPGATPGGETVSFIQGGTSLADAAGDPVTIDFVDSVAGTITVTSSAPEPALMMPLGLALLLGAIRKRRKN